MQLSLDFGRNDGSLFTIRHKRCRWQLLGQLAKRLHIRLTLRQRRIFRWWLIERKKHLVTTPSTEPPPISSAKARAYLAGVARVELDERVQSLCLQACRHGADASTVACRAPLRKAGYKVPQRGWRYDLHHRHVDRDPNTQTRKTTNLNVLLVHFYPGLFTELLDVASAILQSDHPVSEVCMAVLV